MRKIILILALTFSPQTHATDLLEDLYPQIEQFWTLAGQQPVLTNPSADVHIFNDQFKFFGPTLVECNKRLGLNEIRPYAEILDGFCNKRVEFDFKEDLDGELKGDFEAQIQGMREWLVKGRDFDDETGMTVTHMLSAIWNLVLKSDKTNQEQILGEVYRCLRENKLEAGGCFPGYAGRLMYLNAALVTRPQIEEIDFRKNLNKFRQFITEQSPADNLDLNPEEFNAKLKPYGCMLIACNKKMGLNAYWPHTVVLEGLSGMRKDFDFPADIQTHLSAIENLLDIGLDYEKETEMHVAHMLSAIWDHLVKLERKDQPATLSEVFFFLQHNVPDDDHRFNRYAGRLMMVNCLLVARSQMAHFAD